MKLNMNRKSNIAIFTIFCVVLIRQISQYAFIDVKLSINIIDDLIFYFVIFSFLSMIGGFLLLIPLIIYFEYKVSFDYSINASLLNKDQLEIKDSFIQIKQYTYKIFKVIRC